MVELTEVEARQRLIRSSDNVSRETLELLDAYVGLLELWNPRINLVSRGDVERLWSRHLLDSWALTEWVPPSGMWMDVGSGGGFPAIPLAIYSKASGGSLLFRLVESDSRKSAFLREVAARLDLRVEVETARIELVEPRSETIVSARAFAPLGRLLKFLEKFQSSGAQLLLLKGERLHDELTEVATAWHMWYYSRRNPTTSRGYVLQMQRYRRVTTKGIGEP